jgi:hypothetical protein
MKVVYLTDERIPYEEAEKYFRDAAIWAKTACSTFIDYSVVDVSDFTYQYDHVAEYRFKDIKDAQWFKLRWE